jgi:hypothetical protein
MGCATQSRKNQCTGTVTQRGKCESYASVFTLEGAPLAAKREAAIAKRGVPQTPFVVVHHHADTRILYEHGPAGYKAHQELNILPSQLSNQQEFDDYRPRK